MLSLKHFMHLKPSKYVVHLIYPILLFLKVIMILQMMDVGPLVIYMYDKTVYTYPAGAKAVGWILALSSILMIPLVAFVTICRKQGTIKEVS